MRNSGQSKSEYALEAAGITVVTSEERRSGRRLFQYAKFDSLDELRTKVDAGLPKNTWDSIRYSEHGLAPGSSSFDRRWALGSEMTSVNDLREAMEFGRSSRRTLDKVEELRTALLNREGIRELEYLAMTKKKRRVFAESGSELDIDRVMCADPLHWASLTPGKESKVIRIVFNCANSAAASEDDFNMMAACGIVMAELAESAGLSVELYATWISQNVTSEVFFGGIMVKLKSAEYKTDVQALAVSGYPGIMRTYTFFVRKNILDGVCDSGYGTSRGLDELVGKLGENVLISGKWTGERMEMELRNVLNLNNN